MSMAEAARMPYFEEYLRSVLRPKVLEILEAHQGSWHEMVMGILAEAIADDPKSGFKGDRDEVIELLREQLGLKVRVGVKASFSGPDGETEAAEVSGPGATSASAGHGSSVIDADASDAEQVEVRRRPSISPLAQAVSGTKRR